ncbi:MAG: hypothetical protein Q7V43_31580 [Myxococcales bacterium]|nr:hypothetical protein [Myxococcales bacterium]
MTVESDSWAGALSSARGGVSIRKFRCEFENEGVVRVNDLEANERYTVRPYRASLVPGGDAPAAPAADAASPVLRGVTIPPAASGRPSRAPAPASSSGSFSVAPPPGTSVAMPPRSSTPPTPAIAADPVPDIDVPSALSGTVVTSSVPAVVAEKPAEKAPEPAAPAIVPERPAEPPPAPVVAEKPAEPTPVVAEKPAEPAPVVAEKPAEAPAPAPVAVPLDLGATVVDLPIFVAPSATPAPTPEPAPPPATNHEVVEPAAANGSHDAALVSSSLLFERDQDPSATNPLTYRERVLTVASGTSVAQAEALARHSLTALKRALATRPRGRYVTVAVFDHVFSHRPTESPLVVLRWKDWRSDVPELQVRPALPPIAAPTPVSTTVPNGAGAGVEPPVATVVDAPVAAAEPATTTTTPEPVAAAPIVATDSVPAVVEAPVSPAAPEPAAEEPVAAAPSVAAPVTEAAPTPVEAPAVEAPAVEAPAIEAPVAAVAAAAPEAAPPVVVAEAVPAVAAVESAPAAVVAEAAPTVTDAVAEATPAPAADVPAAQPEAPVVPPVAATPAVAAIVADAPAESASTGTESAAAPVAVTPTEDADAGSGEHEAASSDAPGATSAEQGGRRKKRRGRRESQPSLPVVEPSAGAVAVPAAEAPVVAADRQRFQGGRRGPDLLSDLFDSVMELSFQHTAAEVCACVAGIVTQNLRCDAVLVFSYDINRDEFVVQGEANTGRMEQRVRAKAGAYGLATRSKRGVNVAESKGDDRADPGCEGGPAMYVPAMFHERLFALVQIARLPGSPAFEADELDAVTYISGQLAEALAHHSARPTTTELADKKEAPQKPGARRR